MDFRNHIAVNLKLEVIENYSKDYSSSSTKVCGILNVK
jgi:hypothetical protein